MVQRLDESHGIGSRETSTRVMEEHNASAAHDLAGDAQEALLACRQEAKRRVRELGQRQHVEHLIHHCELLGGTEKCHPHLDRVR